MQSPIAIYRLKISIGSHSEPQLVPNVLHQVSVRELQNNMVSLPEEGVIKEARDAEKYHH